MVSVVDEFKGKLSEIDARLVAIREEVALLEGQWVAFKTVIGVCDPSFTTDAPRRPKPDRSTSAKRITDLLKGKDRRSSILITLRDADTPLWATDIAQRFIAREGLEVAAEGLSAGLSGRFSTKLDRLATDGLIRSAEDEGRHRIWEIAR